MRQNVLNVFFCFLFLVNKNIISSYIFLKVFVKLSGSWWSVFKKWVPMVKSLITTIKTHVFFLLAIFKTCSVLNCYNQVLEIKIYSFPSVCELCGESMDNNVLTIFMSWFLVVRFRSHYMQHDISFQFQKYFSPAKGTSNKAVTTSSHISILFPYRAMQ